MFHFQVVDEGLLRPTAERWRSHIAEAGDSVFPPAFEQALTWSADRVSAEGGDDYSYGLVRQGEDYACALAEITHAKHHPDGAMVRLLRVRPEPRLDAIFWDGPDGEIQHEATVVMVAVLVESFRLAFRPLRASVMKACGSHPLTQEFLRYAGEGLRNAGLDAQLKGNWLEISTNLEGIQQQNAASS